MSSVLEDPGFVEAVTSPEFLALPWEERRSRIAAHVPEFKSSNNIDQNTILGLIQKKGNIQTTPKELQGPAPPWYKQALENLPGSALRNATALAKGLNFGNDTDVIGKQNLSPEEMRKSGLERDYEGIKQVVQHPIDSLKNAFVQDPIATTQAVTTAGKAAYDIAPAVADAVSPAINKTAAVVKGAAQGAKEGAISTTELPGHSYAARAAKAVGIDKVPSVAAGAVIGKYGARLIFGPDFEGAGEVIGAASPIVRQAWVRAKQAAADFDAAQRMGEPATPIWKDPNAPLSTVPPLPGEQPAAQGPIPEPMLPSGRSAGPTAPENPPGRAPVWAQGAASEVPQTAPEETSAPQPVALPSGRKVGGIQNQTAEPPGPAPVPSGPEAQWEATAKAMGFKTLSQAPAGIQKAIQEGTMRLKGGPAGNPLTPSPTDVPETPPRPIEASGPAAPAGKTVRQMLDEDLAQRRAANVPPAAPPAAEVAPAPVETPTEAPAPVAAPVPATSEPQAAAPEQPATPPETPASATPRYQIPDNKFGDKLDATDMPVLPGHTKLSSSTAHSAGFDPETGDPQIHFLPWKKAPQGTLYRYPDMPPELLRDAIDHAPSFGKFVREQVRPNYTGIRMQLPEPGAPLLSGVDYGAVEQPVAPPATPEPATPQSESGQTAEPEAAAEPAVSTTPPGTIAQMPTDQIRVDAPRFQFKQNVGQGGAGEELRVVKKFDPEKSGILSVWKDPADNETYVVNGHNRLALAQRTGEPSVTVRYIDAKDAAEARTKGALINIAEGRGDAIDAAKVFRDSGIGPEELEAEGLSPTGSIAKNGMALANLDPYLFNKVVSGELPVERASVIGQGVKEAADQRALFDLLSEREKAGKRLTNDQVGEMIRLTNEAPKLEETQDSLFGSQEMTRSLIPEKAEVSDYIRRQLAQEGKLFQAVATEGAADKLASTGNVIKAGENAKVAVTAAQAKALYDKLSTTAGSVNDALDQAAASIAKGGSSSAAKTIAYQKIKSDLFKQAKSLAGEGEAPTERPQGNGPSGPHQAGGNHPYQVGDTVRVKGVDHPVVIKSIKPNGEIEW